MLPDIINATLRVLHADGIRVVLNSPSGLMTYASGPSAGKMVKFDSLISSLAQEHGPFQIADLAQADKALAPLKKVISGVVALPLPAQYRVLGVLWIAYDNPPHFGADDTTFLSIVAGQTAVGGVNTPAFPEAPAGSEPPAAGL